MGIKDFLRRGSGLDLVTEQENSPKVKSSVNVKKSNKINNNYSGDEKVLKQLESEVSRAIEKLEDIRDKLRVRRGY